MRLEPILDWNHGKFLEREMFALRDSARLVLAICGMLVPMIYGENSIVKKSEVDCGDLDDL